MFGYIGGMGFIDLGSRGDSQFLGYEHCFAADLLIDMRFWLLFYSEVLGFSYVVENWTSTYSCLFYLVFFL